MASPPWDEIDRELQPAVASVLRNDTGAYAGLWSASPDVVLFGALGGYEQGSDSVQERLRWLADNRPATGGVRHEHLATHHQGDLAFRVSLEHNGDGTAQRVTEAFRREDSGWRIVHRHASWLRQRGSDLP